MMDLMRVGARHMVVVACLVAAFAATCVTATASATTGERVFGGSKVAITSHPWQVAIVVAGIPNAYQAQFCGGVIIDERHVITAAHCLDLEGAFDPDTGDPVPDGVVDDPSERQIVAGAGDLGAQPLPATSQRLDIASWHVMPGYDLTADTSPFDVALLTLATDLNTSAPGIRPVVLPEPGRVTSPGTAVQVSGWGTSATLPFGSRNLQATDLLTVADDDCGSFYASDFHDATMLCAIAPGHDSCSGDSGGPLTATDSTLLGLVSWGPRPCANPTGAPGVYTEVAEPAIAAFVRDFTPDPPYAPPTATAGPTLVGVPKWGETLSCQPGTWSSSKPGAPEVEFLFRTSDGVLLRDWSPSAAYTLLATDAGRRVLCVERARDGSGASLASSATSEPVVGPPPAPPAQNPDPTPIAPRDVVAPRASFVSVRCAKRRCRVRVRATDAGNPISGVRDVRVTILPGRGRSRTITAKSLGRGLYEARFTKLRRGSVWFTATARDRAGNVPATVAIRRAGVR